MNRRAARRIEQTAAEGRPLGHRIRVWALPALGIVFALATMAAAISYYRPFDGGIDDADITFTYARNLADGHGFVYNVGGERVEGATSLLWTLACAVVFGLGGSEPAVFGVGLVLCLLTQAIAVRILTDLSGQPPTRTRTAEAIGLYLVLVFSSPGYVTWMTTTLMDVTLWGTLLIAATAVVVRPPRTGPESATAATVWFLLCLTRPEAMWIAPAFAVLAAWRLRAVDPPAARKLLLLLGSVTAATLGGLTLFRLAYFGRPLPNTFYAKVSASPEHNFAAGLEYFGGWLLACPVAAIGLIAAAAIVVGGLRSAFVAPRRGPTAVEVLAWGVILFAPIPAATGGDHFRHHRFLQPLYPLLCILLADCCRRVRPLRRLARLTGVPCLRRGIGRAAVYGTCIAMLIASHETPWPLLHEYLPIKHEFQIAQYGRLLGERLTRLTAGEPLPSIGIVVAGGTGRTYPGEKFDLMGLNDVRMANSPADRTRGWKNHSAFDPEIFYARMPDLVLVSFPLDSDLFHFHDFVLRGIFSEPKFRQAYAYGLLRRLNDSEPPLRSFYRRDWLARLLQRGRHEFAPDPVWENYLKSLDPLPADKGKP